MGDVIFYLSANNFPNVCHQSRPFSLYSLWKFHQYKSPESSDSTYLKPFTIFIESGSPQEIADTPEILEFKESNYKDIVYKYVHIGRPEKDSPVTQSSLSQVKRTEERKG